MTRHTAVAVHDDLAPCQSAVPVRSADHETSCRVHKELRLLVSHIRRNDLIKHIFLNIFVDLLLGHIRIMLRGEHDRLQTLRSSILIVLHRNLCLSVRTEIRKRSVLSHLGELARQLMCHCDRVRHILLCLIGCVSEHHSLISRSDGFDIVVGHCMFLRLKRLVNAHCNIRGLLIDRGQYSAGVCVKSILSSCIADLAHRIAHDLRNINISFRSDLSHNHDHTCRTACLTCHAAHGILLHQSVKDRV